MAIPVLPILEPEDRKLLEEIRASLDVIEKYLFAQGSLASRKHAHELLTHSKKVKSRLEKDHLRRDQHAIGAGVKGG